MALARTAPLRHELESALPRRPFSIRFWDGTEVPATDPGSPTFTFHSPRAFAHVLRAPGELGLGRAYVAGLLDVDDLDSAIRVVGVTLSEPQAELARRRAAEAGVGDLVEIRVADYREVTDGQFDAIASIGMVEHVGAERIDLYARRLASLLRPVGRLLNHGIAKLQEIESTDEGPFSDRFVFPDGVPLPLSRVQLALERAGFATKHVEGFPGDYVKTLLEWLARFSAHEDEAVRLAGIERVRVWRVYLRAARRGFETGYASVFQVLANRP